MRSSQSIAVVGGGDWAVTSADINRAMIAEKSIGEPTDAGSGVASSADSHARCSPSELCQ
jgi:hypothetical protein